ncbi:uncharacterized protein [Argopecten irradians]|uniref:uncharacterized protein n=1 Tax=Argopecten irradians TaxID=31199 RepID=UPI00371DEE27
MYAIIDDQSNRTLCKPGFFNIMDVSGETVEQYTLVSCAGDLPTQGRRAHGFSVSSLNGQFTLPLPDILECDPIPNNRTEIPTPEITNYHSHLKDVKLPPLRSNSEILLLIGRDVPEAHHICEQIIGPPNSPFAQRLNLGWVVVGNGFCEEQIIGQGVFKQTHDDNKVGLSVEDRAFLDLMDKEFVRDTSGILDNGHAEVAPPLNDDEECWYLPLFGVYHPKKPDKIRGFFDSSAKHEGLSLNQVLMKGPDLTNNLLGVLLRFRKEDIAISCDVEQMFYCFGVREDQRNFLRFLWYEDNNPTKPLIEYRMCKHVFGNSPSPAVATYGLRKTVQETENTFGGDVTDFVTKNFYVDDGLTSVPTAQEAVSLLNRTKEALSTGNIRLHKFTSNCEDVLNAMPADDLAGEFRKIEIGTESLPSQRSLGLCWELETDVFTFNISTETKPYTRRGVLSTINSLYAPLGFLSPVTVKGKILLRNMVVGTVDWDQPLPEEFYSSWEHWDTSIQELDRFQVSRRYPVRIDATSELHIYSDASEKTISAVAYLKSLDEKGQSCFGFVLGKSKVAPRHGHTIPRLELCAAVLAVEIAEIVTEELSFPREHVFFHTDRKVVLGYVTNTTRRFYIYVANRVCRILEFLDQTIGSTSLPRITLQMSALDTSIQLA